MRRREYCFSAALVLGAGDSDSEVARARALEVVRGYGEHAYDGEAIDIDLRLREEFLDEEVARAGGQLAVEAKEWFLAQVVRIALADGQLSDEERQALHQIADRLGMTPAHALGVILTTEGAAR